MTMEGWTLADGPCADCTLHIAHPPKPTLPHPCLYGPKQGVSRTFLVPGVFRGFEGFKPRVFRKTVDLNLTFGGFQGFCSGGAGGVNNLGTLQGCTTQGGPQKWMSGSCRPTRCSLVLGYMLAHGSLRQLRPLKRQVAGRHADDSLGDGRRGRLGVAVAVQWVVGCADHGGVDK